MTAHRPFGRRTPGLRGTANAMAHDTGSRSTARLTRAFSDTEDYARGLISRENEEQARSRRSLWIGGLAVVMAVGFALPYLGAGATGPAPHDGRRT